MCTETKIKHPSKYPVTGCAAVAHQEIIFHSPYKEKYGTPCSVSLIFVSGGAVLYEHFFLETYTTKYAHTEYTMPKIHGFILRNSLPTNVIANAFSSPSLRQNKGNDQTNTKKFLLWLVRDRVVLTTMSLKVDAIE